uniref:Uncharacterized protein n=1 Tax=Opuntia streptacantha TaxID=393608 RepID=A0A7C9A6X8_OPUST
MCGNAQVEQWEKLKVALPCSELEMPFSQCTSMHREDTFVAENCFTLLIGYATGKQSQTRTRTRGATAAPIAKPYLEQTACGIICIERTIRATNNASVMY